MKLGMAKHSEAEGALDEAPGSNCFGRSTQNTRRGRTEKGEDEACRAWPEREKLLQNECRGRTIERSIITRKLKERKKERESRERDAVIGWKDD